MNSNLHFRSLISCLLSPFLLLSSFFLPRERAAKETLISFSLHFLSSVRHSSTFLKSLPTSLPISSRDPNCPPPLCYLVLPGHFSCRKLLSIFSLLTPCAREIVFNFLQNCQHIPTGLNWPIQARNAFCPPLPPLSFPSITPRDACPFRVQARTATTPPRLTYSFQPLSRSGAPASTFVL